MLPEGVELKAIGGEIIDSSGNFTFEGSVLTGYTGSDTEVTVPYGVTAIGDLVFYCNSTITKVTLPSTVKTIGHDAFAACYSLREINLPEGLTYIDRYAFSDCRSLTSLVLPSTLTYIGEYAFFGCSNAAGELVISDSVTSIGASAFNGCKGLTKVTLPAGLTLVDEFTFNGCTALTEVVLPEGLTEIGYSAFNGCTALTTINLPESLTTLDNYAFESCALTGEVVIPDPVEYIPIGLFAYNSGIQSLVIGAGVETIYCEQNVTHAFYNMDGLTEITFKGLTVPMAYQGSPFTYMPALETVYVPAAAYADYEAEYGEYLPEGVELVAVGSTATILAQGACGENLTWTLNSNGVLTITGTGIMEDYVYYDVPWSSYKDKITTIVMKNGITQIGGYAFLGLEKVTSVTIPDSVTTIGENAFNSCTGLQEITIPDSVTTIGASAFEKCTGLQAVTVPAGVTTMGNYVFYGCTGLTEAVILGGITTLEDGTFYGCTNLTTVSLPETLTMIDDYAFYSCTGLATIDLPDSLTIIGWDVFEGCTGLTTMVFHESLTEIGAYAFYGCTGLQELTFMGETPPLINTAAFADTAVGTVYVPPMRYTLYKSTISSNLPEGVVFKGLPTVEPEPQGPTCTITETEALVSGNELNDYIEKQATLLMAVYDISGRCLGVTGTVEQSAGGTYEMLVQAEGVETVRLFVMDSSYVPMKAPYSFEK